MRVSSMGWGVRTGGVPTGPDGDAGLRVPLRYDSLLSLFTKYFTEEKNYCS